MKIELTAVNFQIDRRQFVNRPPSTRKTTTNRTLTENANHGDTKRKLWHSVHGSKSKLANRIVSLFRATRRPVEPSSWVCSDVGNTFLRVWCSIQKDGVPSFGLNRPTLILYIPWRGLRDGSPVFSPKIYRVVEALHVLSFFGLDRINSVYKCFFIFHWQTREGKPVFFILSVHWK